MVQQQNGRQLVFLYILTRKGDAFIFFELLTLNFELFSFKSSNEAIFLYFKIPISENDKKMDMNLFTFILDLQAFPSKEDHGRSAQRWIPQNQSPQLETIFNGKVSEI